MRSEMSLIWICLAALGLLESAYAAPNTQLQDIFSVMKSKLEHTGLSAEDAALGDGSGTATSVPPEGAVNATQSEGAAPTDGEPPAEASSTAVTDVKPPEVNSMTTGFKAAARSADTSTAATPGDVTTARPLPGGLKPVPLPDDVPSDAVPPGAVPIKVENGKITFAVVGKKGKTAPNEDRELEEEIMKTPLSKKINDIVHHMRFGMRRFMKNRWDAAKDAVASGSRALGTTVDTTRTYMTVGFAIVANILRRLANFLERLPPSKISSLAAVLLSVPMMPLNVARAVVEETFKG